MIFRSVCPELLARILNEAQRGPRTILFHPGWQNWTRKMSVDGRRIIFPPRHSVRPNSSVTSKTVQFHSAILAASKALVTWHRMMEWWTIIFHFQVEIIHVNWIPMMEWLTIMCLSWPTYPCNLCSYLYALELIINMMNCCWLNKLAPSTFHEMSFSYYVKISIKEVLSYSVLQFCLQFPYY